MNEKLCVEIDKIFNEPEESGYTEWLHKIDQFERAKGLWIVFYDSSTSTKIEEEK